MKDAAVIQAGWVHAPHLSKETIEEFRRSTPPHLLDARMNGNPTMGSGNVYQIPKADILIEPIQIQPYWKKLYGFDVGWNVTAAIFGALDTDTDTIYLYHEYYGKKKEPVIHASAIKAVAGDWMPGMIDPASRGRSQIDGQKLISLYRKEGLKLREANNAREAGISAVYSRLSTGRLKVFKTLHNWSEEYSLYIREEDGSVKKETDHLMDAMRYLVIDMNHAKFSPNHFSPNNNNSSTNPYSFDD